MSPHHVILPGSPKVMLALLSGVFTLASLALTIGLSLDATVPADYTLPIVLLGSLFTLTGALYTYAYLQPANGIMYDAKQDRIGLSIQDSKDLWWLPRQQLAGLLLRSSTNGEGMVQRWALSLQLRSQVEILLAESDQRTLIDQVAEGLKSKLKLKIIESPHFGLSGGLSDGTLDLSVNRRAALSPLLVSAGICLGVMSVFGFLGIQESPLIGFALSPILLVLGLVLLGISLVKRFSREQLKVEGGRLTHTIYLGSKAIFERTFFNTELRLSVLNLGLRGALFELRSPTTTLVFAAGSSMRSHQTVAELEAKLASLIPPN